MGWFNKAKKVCLKIRGKIKECIWRKWASQKRTWENLKSSFRAFWGWSSQIKVWMGLKIENN